MDMLAVIPESVKETARIKIAIFEEINKKKSDNNISAICRILSDEGLIFEGKKIFYAEEYFRKVFYNVNKIK